MKQPDPQKFEFELTSFEANTLIKVTHAVINSFQESPHFLLEHHNELVFLMNYLHLISERIHQLNWCPAGEKCLDKQKPHDKATA